MTEMTYNCYASTIATKELTIDVQKIKNDDKQ